MSEEIKNQGEPVAWVRVIDGEAMRYSWFGNKRLPVGKHQLYTHADPGEVERLQTSLSAVKFNLNKTDKGLLAADAEVRRLRAQLAQRDELLRDIDEWMNREDRTPGDAIEKRMCEILSASSEPKE